MSAKVVFVCTDRGQHKEQVVHIVTVDGELADLTGAALAPPAGSWLGFDCRLCDRTPRMRHDTGARLFDAALVELRGGARRVRYDISAFPF